MPLRKEPSSAARCKLMMFTGVVVVALGLAVCAASTLSGCAPSTSSSAGERAGILRVGLHAEPHSLSPILPQHAEEFMIDRLYSDVLTSFDSRGNLVPILAADVPSRSNGGISADERTITYRLRHNVRWQDGAAFTSADVAFTWHAVMNPRNNVVSRAGYNRVTRVETPDRFTVRFVLKRRFAPIVAELFGDGDSPYGMLPEHLLAHSGELNDVPFNTLPIGTGPYRVAKWVRGERIELVANSDYFLGKPKIARITLLFVPDENTIVQLLRTHDIDWLPEASPSVVPLLRGITGIRQVNVNQNHWYGLYFNMKSAAVGDIRVRRAIAAAIDRPRLTRELTYGTAVPATVDIPSFMWAYPRNVVTMPFSLPQARRSLAALGRPAPVIALAYDQTSGTSRATAIRLQDQLATVGITLRIRGYRRETFLGPMSAGGILQSGNYDIGLARWLYGPDPDNSGEFSCDVMPPNGYNNERYCNAEMEAAQRDALEHVDRKTRTAAYARIERLVARDLPIFPLWWPRAVHAFSTGVRGFAPNGLISTWNAYQWSLRPN